MKYQRTGVCNEPQSNWNVKSQGYVIKHDEAKYQMTGICNDPQSSEMSKIRDMQLITIKWNVKGQGYPMNQN